MRIKYFLLIAAASLAACQTAPEVSETDTKAQEIYQLIGYASEVAWGEHLVEIGLCNDCHSPKKMTEMGPIPDPARLLSGHAAAAPVANLDRTVIEKNGYGASDPDFTSWIGPWGISFAGNLTPHETGIGNWSKEQFVYALRNGKLKGLEGGRALLPPMPWPSFARMSDAELSAMFAYLQSIPPVDNLVPLPVPPLSAQVAAK